MNDKTFGAGAHRNSSSALSEDAPGASSATAEEEDRSLFFSDLGKETVSEESFLLRAEKDRGTDLLIKESNNGKGVFTKRNFRKGETVIQFYGERLTREKLLSAIDDGDSHYMQIGKGVYLGPSGRVDDFFNHSCEPNAGVIIERDTAFLVAIKTIPKDTEVTFDYSTTMDDDWEKMECNCTSPHCRKYVRDFKYLPDDVQNEYLQMGIVPEYIRNNYR